MSLFVKLFLPICCMLLSFVACNHTELKYSKNNNTIENFDTIKKLNSLILNNLNQLADSCCRHLGNSCNDPDSLRQQHGYPINENLAQKYISKREPGIERIIKVLTPSTIQSNSTPIRGNISFSLDSSVIYSCYKENNSDTIVEHHLIYSKQSISNFHAKESKVILKETIEKNWTYLVVKYLYIW